MSYFEELKDKISNVETGDAEGYSELLKNYLSEYSIEQYKLEIKDILCEQFGIDKNECEIVITTKVENEELQVETMQILLYGGSIFKNPYDIEDYFKNLIGCKCVVLIKSG